MKRSLVVRLNHSLGSFVNNKVVAWLISATLFANPFALAPSVYAAFTASNLEAIALPMWFVFGAIQFALVLEGIRKKSTAMFWSMLLSCIESVSIIIIVFIRA